MPTISISLDEDSLAKLDSRAMEFGVGRSAMVRLLIKHNRLEVVTDKYLHSGGENAGSPQDE